MTRAQFGMELAGAFDPPTTRHLIERVDALGFDYLWWCDYRFYRDVYSLLTRTALTSGRLRYGPFVTDPFARHPALTALAMATADELGGGRGVLGLGAGVSGLREMGIPRDRPATRIFEAIDILRALWRDGHASYQGRTVSLTDCALDFTPRPDIPILVASNSARGLGVAGEKGDGLIVEGLRRKAMLDYVRPHVQRGLDRSGRSWSDLHVVARLDLCIHDDPSVAWQVLRGSVQHYVSVHGAERWPDLAEFVPPPLEAQIREAGFTHDPEVVARLTARIPDEAGALIALGGTEDDVLKQVTEVLELGVSQLVVFPKPSPEHGITIPDLVERFGRVISRL